MFKNKNVIQEKMKESTKTVLPISIIILILCMTISPIDVSNFTSFLFGTFLLIVGIALFNIGANVSMSPMGEYVGAQMTKSKKVWLIVILSFIVGCMITMSEPDLQVLADYAPSIGKVALIISVSCGVGVFLVFAMLRIIFGIKLKYLLLGFYSVILILSFFVDKDFLAIAFDSGGVTTGPMTVPFIMALGVGVASIRSDSKQSGDSFGLISLCSIGPIMSVMILGLIRGTQGSSGNAFEISQFVSSKELGLNYIESLPKYLKEVSLAVFPIVIFFFVYQLFARRLSRSELAKIAFGIIYTFIGLVLFLTGANVGFMPAGYLIGKYLGLQSFSFIVIPIGMVIGYFIVAAEPAVQVLQKQVESITSGAIPQKALSFALEIGVSVSVGIAMLRSLTGISIVYPLIIGYFLSFVLSFFVPDIFTSIAFDSGGVASGAMTTAFLLPFAIGVCESSGGNIVTDAFGTVAMVAMTPLIAIQILGVVYRIRISKVQTAASDTIFENTIIATSEINLVDNIDNTETPIITISDDDIIDFD